jgi:hypothetical protein
MGDTPSRVGTLALGAVLAAGVAIGVVIAVLEHGEVAVDANVGGALARPIVLRLAELAVAAGFVAAWAAHVGGHGPRLRTLALLGLLGHERLWLLPALYGAWERVDRVAEQPAAAVEVARALALQHGALGVAVLALLAACGVAWLRAASRPRIVVLGGPAPEPAAHAA